MEENENVAKAIQRSREEYERHTRPPALRFDTTRWDIAALRARIEAIEAHLRQHGPTDLDGKPVFTPFTPEADDVQSGEYQIHDTKVGPVLRKGE